MIFFISDTHFSHTNVIKYSKRPFVHAAEMNNALMKNWNKVVKPGDTVYHLGDFAFEKQTDVRARCAFLNGQKHLILGNHDKEIVKHRNKLLECGAFASIQEYKEIKYEDRKFVLFHYGMRVWNKSHHGSIHLYGHSHGSLPPHGLSVDVGVDSKEITSEYRPVSIEEIVSYMNKKEIAIVDHHGAIEDE